MPISHRSQRVSIFRNSLQQILMKISMFTRSNWHKHQNHKVMQVIGHSQIRFWKINHHQSTDWWWVSKITCLVMSHIVISPALPIHKIVEFEDLKIQKCLKNFYVSEWSRLGVDFGLGDWFDLFENGNAITVNGILYS